MKNLALAATLTLTTGSLSASFVSIENFESGTSAWTTGAAINFGTAADPDNASNTVGTFSYGSGDQDAGWAWVPLGATITGTDVATVFYQAYLPGPTWSYNHTVNATDVGPATGDVAWGDLDAIGRFGDGTSGGQNDFFVHDGSYQLPAATTGTIDIGSWYNVWYVIDSDTGSTDFYIESADDSDFTSQTLVYADASFRGSQGTGIDNFLIKVSNDGAASGLMIDNIFIDASGQNLANPIPEPATFGLLAGVVALGLVWRRRKA